MSEEKVVVPEVKEPQFLEDFSSHGESLLEQTQLKSAYITRHAGDGEWEKLVSRSTARRRNGKTHN